MSDTVGTADTGPRNTRGRVWSFTHNNYDENDIVEYVDYLVNEEYCFQEEMGEQGTAHLQGCCRFKNARTFSALKNRFKSTHWEMGRKWVALQQYCCKEESRVGRIFTNIEKLKKKLRIILDPLKDKVLYPWQNYVLDYISKGANDREILWIVDEVGCGGKTTLCKHICLQSPDKSIYMGGKANDIKYGISCFLDSNELEVCLFDFTRSLENYISYEAIEAVKNGIFYNSKYESKMVIFNQPHVVCFANFYPDESKLSEDRWNIRNIETESRGINRPKTPDPFEQMAGSGLLGESICSD